MATSELVQQRIESFDMTIVPGSVKTMMAGIKAAYEPKDEKASAAKPLSDAVKKVMTSISAVYSGGADEGATGVPKIKGAGGSSDLWKVPVSELKVLEGFNVRLPGPALDEHIEFLTDSILEEGFFQHRPLAALVLEVDGELGLYVFDGHCRLTSTIRAIAKGAEIDLVPVVVQDGRNVNLDDLYVQMHRLNKGKELTPFEIGLLCKRLSKYGHPDSVIATRMGIKPSYVDSLLRLVNAPKPLVDAVLSDEISPTEAIQMIRTYGNGAVVEELEARRARALAELKNKAPVVTTSNDEQGSEQPAATPLRPRLTARHASDANVKKVVRKHALDLFMTTRAIKSDPAYSSLAEQTRQKLDELLAQLEVAEKADNQQPQAEQKNQDGAAVTA
ncbi:TPA: hypothetical protein L6A34_31285 [Pseudomonas aeruginosa]|jgi:hypothetical protein|uniref:hypothetical protein n=1 Tax=Pseudomonas aeruginosa TaxID=287 RepID=UPI00071B724F|nr:hypothetical protein [Pseudomonas aeruginosa]ELQ8317558.1 hypothetical protein [Pseudomonas aeruginosa]KSM65096.1 hypothetical protein APA70_22135 [Pseudomonas aeruginosa]HBP5961570.1 hypothetical protein [Pseudomonas aeruginosa]HBP6298931.1 hypothetical protein [Pseudomonas aeruginosa]HBP6386405.1 hypothetical protein [Pseudomonas aeruginosa]